MIFCDPEDEELAFRGRCSEMAWSEGGCTSSFGGIAGMMEDCFNF